MDWESLFFEGQIVKNGQNLEVPLQKTGDSLSPEWPPTAIFVLFALDDGEASGPTADWSGSRAWPHVTGESPKGNKALLAEAAKPWGPAWRQKTERRGDFEKRHDSWAWTPSMRWAGTGERWKWQRSDSGSCIKREETQTSRAGKFSHELLARWAKQRWLLTKKQ